MFNRCDVTSVDNYNGDNDKKINLIKCHPIGHLIGNLTPAAGLMLYSHTKVTSGDTSLSSTSHRDAALYLTLVSVFSVS